MAIVLGLHVTLFLVQLRFLLLQVAGFTGGQLSVGHAVGDPVLLVLFALLNRVGLKTGGCGVVACVGVELWVGAPPLRRNWGLCDGVVAFCAMAGKSIAIRVAPINMIFVRSVISVVLSLSRFVDPLHQVSRWEKKHESQGNVAPACPK